MGRRGRTAALTYLIVATVLYGLTSPFVLMAITFLPLAFDAPGAEKNPATKLFAFSLLTSPLTIVVATPLAWLLFNFRRHILSVLAVSLPLVNLLLFVIAIIWLEVRYGGVFAGH